MPTGGRAWRKAISISAQHNQPPPEKICREEFTSSFHAAVPRGLHSMHVRGHATRE
ncbi:unnamed protein product [Ectocarpus sp. CCAP 1310/34]|nr:unnamed protein product [Ectocarpus sp. CCAP 1310/34]